MDSPPSQSRVWVKQIGEDPDRQELQRYSMLIEGGATARSSGRIPMAHFDR